MWLRFAMALCALPLGIAAAQATETGLLCMAPSDPADSGKPLAQQASIEFYLDAGNPLAAYTVPFSRLAATRDSGGRTVISYGIWGSKTEHASVVFYAPDTPLTFTLPDIHRTVATIGRDREQTAAMADAIPGIACWKVDMDGAP